MDRDYWQKRWENEDTPWDMGGVHPLLSEGLSWLSDYGFSVKSVLVPGCGGAHDASFLSQYFKTCGNDFSQAAMQVAKEQYPESSQLIYSDSDFFELSGRFDMIFDRAMLVALPMDRREEYFKKSKDLLNDNGVLLGLFGEKKVENQIIEGPPWPLSMTELVVLVEPHFRFVRVETRNEKTHMVLLQKKGVS